MGLSCCPRDSGACDWSCYHYQAEFMDGVSVDDQDFYSDDHAFIVCSVEAPPDELQRAGRPSNRDELYFSLLLVGHPPGFRASPADCHPWR